MDGALGQQRRERGAVEHSHRRAIAAPDRPRTGGERLRLAFVSGESSQTAPASFRIGERRGDGVAPVDPVFEGPRLARATARWLGSAWSVE